MRELRPIMLDAPEPADTDQRRQTPTRQSIDEAVSALAKRVRTIYCICRREFGGRADQNYGGKPIAKWDGGEDAFGNSHKRAVWPKIAFTIIECNADPVMFIRAQFSGANWSRPPAPNMMYNTEAVCRWEDYRHNAKVRLKQQMESDVNQVRVSVLPLTATLHWEYRRALEQVLSNSKISVTPLTRYYLAVNEGMAIADRFREAAILQYLFQIFDYDELLGGKIPRDFHQDAVELRARLVG